MREIKFRAWNKSLKEMWTEVDNFSLCLEEVYNKDIADPWYFPDCELMQYTGLKDKNGKEIYEGDIIRYEDTYTVEGINPVHEIDEGVIEWHQDTAGFVIHWPESGLQNLDEVEIEIIGNIFENKELIK